MKKQGQKIRVLRLIARLNVGGPAIHTILLTKYLAPERFESTLATGCVSSNEGDMRYLAEEQGVVPQIIPEMGREIHWKSDLLAFWKIYRLMRALRPTIVHTHTAKAGMLGRLAAKLAGVPILVHTFHGHVFHSYFSARKTRLFLGIERQLAIRSNAIITLSPTQREEILGYQIGTPQTVRVIGLGLDLQPFLDSQAHAGQLRQELGLEADIPLIGIAARLVPVKGLSYFLDAAQLVLAQRENAHFVIAGDGELRPELEQQAETLGIRDRVHFLGFRRDLPTIYADLDLVALSSLNEGLPVTLIEAMSSATPVVATQVGGVGDLVRDGVSGILTPPRHSAALAQGMLEVLAHSQDERRQMGKAGRDRVYPQYHITTLTRNLAELYEELLAR